MAELCEIISVLPRLYQLLCREYSQGRRPGPGVVVPQYIGMVVSFLLL